MPVLIYLPSGLGFSICCRLMDEFLQTRPPNATLTLIPTVRSQSKADDTLERLNKHLDKYCQNVERTAPAGTASLIRRRVSIVPELLDLCNLISVRKAAKNLKSRYTRLNAIILNAGIGGWTGVDWLGAIKQFLTEGANFIRAPAYKIAPVGLVVNKQVVPVPEGTLPQEEEPPLGEVFCANVFGHYLLAHSLTPLLSRSEGQEEAGRIIWVSTLEAWAKTFDVDDLQGIANPFAYESSKRLTDLLVLSADLQGPAASTKAFFSPGSSSSSMPESATSGADLSTRSLRSSTRLRSTPTKSDSNQSSTSGNPQQHPKMYLSHPGICVTSIMPIPWIMVYGWVLALYIARFCGSPWHTTTPYAAATSMTWLALADAKTLDEIEGKTKCKWGSAVNWLGKERVKKTIVDGWATEMGEPVKGKERAAFEDLGKRCWAEMEELRKEWERRLGDEAW
jgi:3-keto steroid reductase